MTSWFITLWDSAHQMYRIGQYVEWALIVLIFAAAIIEIAKYYSEDHSNKKYLPFLAIGLILLSGFLAIGKLWISDLERERAERDRQLQAVEQTKKDEVADAFIETQKTTEKALRDEISRLAKELSAEKIARQAELDDKLKIETFKRTPPEFDVVLVLRPFSPPKMRFTLVFITKNSVPYDFQWNLTDSKGVFLDNSIWIGWAEVRPKPGKQEL